MPISAEPRVALYFDFDNIVISRYDQLHGDSQYRRDTSRRKTVTPGSETAERLTQATVDVDAVLDFAATFGTIAIARAYADWSTPVNASYRGQLIDRAVDLVQLFPLSATKNGADIRLAVDAIEDMFRIDDLTHIVIVAGDSDYVALAQKAKRLGRYVVGIGVAGGTSRALTAACDEYADYDALLSTDDSVDQVADAAEPAPVASSRRGSKKPASKSADAAAPADAAADADPDQADAADAAAAPAKRTNRRAKSGGAATKAATSAVDDEIFVPATTGPRGVPSVAFMSPDASAPTRNPGRLLVKALELLRAKNDDEWQSSGAVKNQMLRMDPSFQERRLGFGSFTDFLKSRAGVVEVDESGRGRVRIRPEKD
ncbi:NYN domain-containing protein [Agromyces allii]|uniref:HTH OST-type domain-containing protein n=1 Tax=Agromyces allii TaxID=393607 RepID=A0ABN2QNV4_9MICO|nr:NYN domain-containing protein [Agromyces allii]